MHVTGAAALAATAYAAKVYMDDYEQKEAMAEAVRSREEIAICLSLQAEAEAEARSGGDKESMREKDEMWKEFYVNLCGRVKQEMIRLFLARLKEKLEARMGNSLSRLPGQESPSLTLAALVSAWGDKVIGCRKCGPNHGPNHHFTLTRVCAQELHEEVIDIPALTSEMGQKVVGAIIDVDEVLGLGAGVAKISPVSAQCVIDEVQSFYHSIRPWSISNETIQKLLQPFLYLTRGSRTSRTLNIVEVRYSEVHSVTRYLKPLGIQVVDSSTITVCVKTERAFRHYHYCSVPQDSVNLQNGWDFIAYPNTGIMKICLLVTGIELDKCKVWSSKIAIDSGQVIEIAPIRLWSQKGKALLTHSTLAEEMRMKQTHDKLRARLSPLWTSLFSSRSSYLASKVA